MRAVPFQVAPDFLLSIVRLRVFFRSAKIIVRTPSRAVLRKEHDLQLLRSRGFEPLAAQRAVLEWSDTSPTYGQDALRTCAIDGENEGQRRALLTARGGGDSHSPSGANASAPRALRPPRNTPVQRYGVVRHQRNSLWTPRRVQHGAEGAEEMPACGVQRVVESLVAGLRSSDGPSTRSSIVMRPCVRVKRRRARRAV